jgi:amino acid adenylation domain-containing protein
MIDRNNVEDVYSLSPLQEGMLFHHILEEISTAYFVQTAVTLNGEVDVELLELTFNKIIERYDILRTIFTYKKTKKPRQVVLKQGKIDVLFMDISHLGESESRDFTARFRQKDERRGFDLTSEIPMRISLLKIGPSRFILVWSFHHIVMDGWCQGIIFKDVMAIYGALRSGESVHLKSVTPYKEYILWLEKQDRETGLNYWKIYLEGKEQQTVVPRAQSTISNDEPFRLCEYRFVIDRIWTDELNRMARENRVTLNSVFRALWSILLKVYNNASDVIFGAVVSNRPSEIEGIEQMVGLLINTIPVRVKTDGSTMFARLLRQIQQAVSPLNRQLISHIMVFENYPLERSVHEHPGSDAVGFFIEDVASIDRTHYNFTLTVGPGKKSVVRFSFNPYLYDNQTVRRIETHLIQAIACVVENPRISVREIDILTDEEKKRILYEFNDTAVLYPEKKTIHELFEEKVKTVGDNVAVIARGIRSDKMSITYRELNEKSGKLAQLLQTKGAIPGSIVCLMVERSMVMIIGVLGILKAGGAYLPIDPSYPEERIKYMVSDSSTELLVTTGTLVEENETLRKWQGENILLDKILEASNIPLYHFSPALCDGRSLPDLAYIIYTSGSTGRPKGVMIRHRSLVNFLKGITDVVPFGCGDRILSLTTICFDIFGLETILPLTHGGRVILGTEDEQASPELIASILEREGVTIFQVTPSRLQLLIADEDASSAMGGLDYLLVGGEEFQTLLLEKVRTLMRGKIYNMYGPTETTIWSTLKYLTGNIHPDIGKPIANTQIYILDSGNRSCPIGVPGDLYIAGDGLARGYLNRPELTAERFNGAYKSYKTGDLARWLTDGNIEFLGRRDYQVKIRGFRVELGEIENRLLSHPEINEALVVVSSKGTGLQYLCAYIVPHHAGAFEDSISTAENLRNFLSLSIPYYMIPAYFVRLERMPLTPNGKIARNSLPDPRKDHLEVDDAFVAPGSEMEELIARAWREVLELEKVGVHHNFFDLGGNSSTAIKLSSRLRKIVGREIRMVTLFQYPTIHSFARYLKTLDSGESIVDRESEEKKLQEVDRLLLESLQLLGGE